MTYTEFWDFLPPSLLFVHKIYTGWSIWSDSWVGLTDLRCYTILPTHLLSQFCQFPNSPSRTRQMGEQLKSKSTQPNYPNSGTTATLYCLSTNLLHFLPLSPFSADVIPPELLSTYYL